MPSLKVPNGALSGVEDLASFSLSLGVGFEELPAFPEQTTLAGRRLGAIFGFWEAEIDTGDMNYTLIGYSSVRREMII